MMKRLKVIFPGIPEKRKICGPEWALFRNDPSGKTHVDMDMYLIYICD